MRQEDWFTLLTIAHMASLEWEGAEGRRRFLARARRPGACAGRWGWPGGLQRHSGAVRRRTARALGGGGAPAGGAPGRAPLEGLGYEADTGRVELGAFGFTPGHKLIFRFDFGDDHRFQATVTDIHEPRGPREQYPRFD